MSLFNDFEDEIIADIARRVAKTGRYTETAELMAKSMREQGYSPAQIQKEVMKHLRANKEYQMFVAENTKAYKEEVREIINQTVKEAKRAGDELVAQAGEMSWNSDLSMWTEHGVDLKKPNTMSQLKKAFSLQTANELRNLTRTLGFKNANTGTEGVLSAYQRELDLAVIKVATGTFSYDQAVKDCVERLAKSGLRHIDYESGRTYQIDTAVRNAVRTGCSQLAGKIMEENLKSSEQDLVITSQHLGSRPEHAPWQNKVFSYSGKSRKYPDFFKETGYGTVTGLKGANCMHDFYPFWEGASVIPKDLKEPDPVMINGKEYTYYQCTQKQRSMERDIRALKREINACDTLGMDSQELNSKLKQKMSEYRKFSDSANMKPKMNRLRIFNKNESIPRLEKANDVRIKRTHKEIYSSAAEIQKEIQKFTPRKSKWSGKFIFDDMRCDKHGVDGGKEWDCSILLRENATDHVIAHELLHSYSISHFGEADYIKYRKMEEATVELLARELTKSDSKSYENYVVVLQSINSTMKFEKTDFDFALMLFNMKPSDRYLWLYDNVNEYLIKNDVSLSDTQDILEFIKILEDM